MEAKNEMTEKKIDVKLEIFLKQQAGSVITSVAKVLETETIEIGGGAIETYEEPCEVSMEGYTARGFIECSKDEYDEVVKRNVKWINELI